MKETYLGQMQVYAHLPITQRDLEEFRAMTALAETNLILCRCQSAEDETICEGCAEMLDTLHGLAAERRRKL